MGISKGKCTPHMRIKPIRCLPSYTACHKIVLSRKMLPETKVIIRSIGIQRPMVTMAKRVYQTLHDLEITGKFIAQSEHDE